MPSLTPTGELAGVLRRWRWRSLHINNFNERVGFYLIFVIGGRRGGEELALQFLDSAIPFDSHPFRLMAENIPK